MEERTLGTTHPWTGKRIRVRVDEVERSDGHRTTREIVRDNVVTRFNILLGVLLVVVLVVLRQPRDALFGIVLASVATFALEMFRGDFGIQFDQFHTTHSEENKEVAQGVYLALREAGHIHTKTIEQAYDPEAKRWLWRKDIKSALLGLALVEAMAMRWVWPS